MPQTAGKGMRKVSGTHCPSALRDHVRCPVRRFLTAGKTPALTAPGTVTAESISRPPQSVAWPLCLRRRCAEKMQPPPASSRRMATLALPRARSSLPSAILVALSSNRLLALAFMNGLLDMSGLNLLAVETWT